MRPEGLSQWNIPVTPSVIEPATFLLVAHLVEDRPPEGLYLEVIWVLPVVIRPLPEIDPRPVHMGSLVEKVALGRICLCVPRFFPYKYHFTNAPYSYSFIYHRRFVIVAYDGSFSKWCIERGQKSGDWKPTNSVYNEKLRQTVWLLEEFIILNPVAVIVCSACSLIYLLYSLVRSFNVTRV